MTVSTCTLCSGRAPFRLPSRPPRPITCASQLAMPPRDSGVDDFGDDDDEDDIMDQPEDEKQITLGTPSKKRRVGAVQPQPTVSDNTHETDKGATLLCDWCGGVVIPEMLKELHGLPFHGSDCHECLNAVRCYFRMTRSRLD